MALRRLQVLFPNTILGQHRTITTEAMKLNHSLEIIDPELNAILESEKARIKNSINLISSENLAPKYVLEGLGSVMTNKYSEGYPSMRYYGGNKFIDQSEELCKKRALQAFCLNPESWGVNVQPLSGSPANFSVYTALLEPHERILGLDLPHGGHLSHGYQTPTKKVSAVSKFFESFSYKLDQKTGLIDYDSLEYLAKVISPKIIIAGATSYSRLLDYKRFRNICDQTGAYLMADMAHISGPVAAGVIPSPFEYADIVTTTTHKSLRGPRGAMIFYKKGYKNSSSGKAIYYDLEDKINWAVFPGLQGGPHENVIAALAVTLKEAMGNEFKEYQSQVLKNAHALSESLINCGFDIVSGGTDNHQLLVDLRSNGISGAKMETMCEFVNISVNKNTIPTDKSALNPNGIRLGSPAMTTRGLLADDFKQIAQFLKKAADESFKIAKISGPKLLSYTTELNENPPISVLQLKQEVQDFASKFPTVGF